MRPPEDPAPYLFPIEKLLILTMQEQSAPPALIAGIPSLIALLSGGADLDVTAKAAAALWSLADSSNTNKDCVRESDGIAPLVALLSAGPDRKATVKAAGALGSLAFNRA